MYLNLLGIVRLGYLKGQGFALVLSLLWHNIGFYPKANQSSCGFGIMILKVHIQLAKTSTYDDRMKHTRISDLNRKIPTNISVFRLFHRWRNGKSAVSWTHSTTNVSWNAWSAIIKM